MTNTDKDVDPDGADAGHSDDDYEFIEVPDLTRQLISVSKPEAPEPEEVKFYRYEALPSNQCFRLLRLSARASGEMQCSLRIVDINSESQYRAVSYVWGEDVEESVLLIRGPDSSLRPLTVRKNVITLLNCVRGVEPCWLWIDAICINQRSDEERGNQVKLMGEIYSKSGGVLSWLGQDDRDEIGHAFEFMRRATSANATQTSVEAYCNSLAPKAMITVWAQQVSEWEYDWDCLVKFSELANWTRKWIIQEIIKAPSVVLHAGSNQLAMTVAENFLGQLERNPYSDVRKYDNRTGSLDSYEKGELNRYWTWQHKFGKLNLNSTSAALLARHRLDRRTGKPYPQTLHELLIRYEDHKCKEPSDHVYALFNLVGEHRKHLEVDYTKTSAERCRTVLQFMQKHDHLPQANVVRFTNLLLTKLEVTKEADIRSRLERDEDLEAVSVEVTVFDRGILRLEEESTEILERRKRLPDLCAIPRWVLCNTAGHFEVEAKSEIPSIAFVNDEHLVSPNDLTCFSIDNAEVFGLATTRVRNGDRIWQFRETSLGFVVRTLTAPKDSTVYRDSTSQAGSQISEIVGRAVLFPKAGAFTLDRLKAQSLHTSSTLTSREIRLRPADLFDLAFWADSVGPAASPFSG